MKRILVGCLVLFAGAGLLSSCSITQGSVVPTSHYVYPNSNVTPLGHTSAEVKKFGFILPPRFRARDLDRLYGDAMSRHQGSDILIDSKVDSRNTFLFIFHFMKVTIDGTAAKMEVGKQDIGQPGFVRNNDQVLSQPQTSQPAENAPAQQQTQTTQSQVVQPQVTNTQPYREERVKKERQPSKPARLFVQADYVKRDFVKPGFGLGGEFFIGGKVFALAPSINIFSSQRLDLGYALGTFEAKQTAVWFDQHYYFVNKKVGVYGLTTITYENSRFDKFEAGSSVFSSDHAIGGGVGLGLSGEFLNGRLIPFLELRYIALSAFGYEAEMNPYWSAHNGRLSWGLKYSFKGSD